MATTSSYRFVYGEPSKPSASYNELKTNQTTIDSNLLAANGRFVAVPWESRGGGLFTVLTATGSGKIGVTAPMFSGHSNAVIDLAFSPFNQNLIASASEDTTVKLWNIQVENGQVKPNNEPLATLKGHGKRVGRIAFNPLVDNCLASFGIENNIKIWDISKATAIATIKAAKDNLMDLAWNQDGTNLVFPAKDKMLHMIDPRQTEEIFAVKSHPGLRGGRALFFDQRNYIVSTGFSQQAARQITLRDRRNPETPVATTDVDFGSSVLCPFMDHDTGILYTFGRGDNTAKYYELREDNAPIFALSGWQYADSFRAFCQAPKYCVDTAKCEIDRFYVVTHKRDLLTVPFIVPRKNADVFQEDIYPETVAPEPTMSIEDWQAGGKPEPKMISLENGYQLKESEAFTVSQEEPIDTTPLKNELVEARQTIADLKKRITELESEIAALKQ